MLRLDVPNKGELTDRAQLMLAEAGYGRRRDSKELLVVDPDNACELFFLRPRDIAVYVGEGMLDAGITGRDMLVDSGARAEEITGLGFGRSALYFAAPPGCCRTAEDLNGLRVATSYAGLVEKHLADIGVDARIIKLDGSVETAIRLDVADAVADVVESGTRLREVGLEAIGPPVLRSEAVLIKRLGAPAENGLRQLIGRLSGVQVARDFVTMDYDIAHERVGEAIAITSGMEAPTVSELSRDGWVAVSVMVPREGHQRIMDRLWEAGAHAILVTDIYVCRI
ncbi:ATP phosphoribosyltransferase [Nonomuraea sp. K274]|uniref:ATP phosphoribosyltransferase n=1 Tax=Nonomuraea cypriaca TaxID=1187855 RepID=A0A931ABG3_9ACTN|nr:ATP phosphoribosyltransferase [Nonomuraea cypriaca]MBF8187503.1 ATP phosphoribosyltransferase [Nonomuraea cypriaca]